MTYRISSYSFRPWIVSSLEQFPHIYVLWPLVLCTVTFGFPNSKKNSFRGNYMRKYVKYHLVLTWTRTRYTTFTNSKFPINEFSIIIHCCCAPIIFHSIKFTLSAFNVYFTLMFKREDTCNIIHSAQRFQFHVLGVG